jgi:hypothetical protein
MEGLFVKNKYIRRPFTYIMRDWWIEHKIVGTAIFTLITAILVFVCLWSLPLGLPLWAFHWSLFAHLWWGSGYKKDEQEYPPYVEPEH